MKVDKALAFRASSIGDALMAKHFLENVHAAYPGARCGIVVSGRGAMIRNLLASYPWIEVIEANRRDARSLWSLWREFRGSDLVMTGYVKPGGSFSLPSKLFARLLAKRGGLIGFSDASRLNGMLYDHLLPFAMDRAPRLFEEDALTAARVPISTHAMTLEHLPQPGLLKKLGLEGKQYLVLHLFAGSENRAMSLQKRQSLIDALARALPDVPLLLTGTNADVPFIQELNLPEAAQVVAGMLSVQELAALITGSACMVSIGTGPSHMASHLGTPLVVLVVCYGIPWCGEEQFGEGVRVKIHSAASVCKNGHDKQQQFPACIEGIDIDAVASDAVEYVATRGR